MATKSELTSKKVVDKILECFRDGYLRDFKLIRPNINHLTTDDLVYIDKQIETILIDEIPELKNES